MATRRGSACVVGAGAIGLHTADELTASGFGVTVVSLPANATAVTPFQVSCAAAGLIEPVATAPADAQMVTDLFAASYAVWLGRVADPTLGVDRRRVRYRPDPTEGVPAWVDHMVGATYHGDGTVGFDTAVVTPPVFITETKRRLAARGVVFTTRVVDRLADLGTGRFDLVVNASGPRAWTLGDLEMYGRRGVLVWVRAHPRLAEVRFDAESFNYGVPQRELVAFGGTADEVHGDPAGWDRMPRVREVVEILHAAARLYPEVDVSALSVADVACNYRPSRTRIRIEADRLGATPVVHITGFGGSGWTLAPAAAHRARVLAESFIGQEQIA